MIATPNKIIPISFDMYKILESNLNNLTKIIVLMIVNT